VATGHIVGIEVTIVNPSLDGSLARALVGCLSRARRPLRVIVSSRARSWSSGPQAPTVMSSGRPGHAR
jgi:hypothetical protein